MSEVKVIYYGFPFKIILDSQEEECSIPDNATVMQLLQLLVGKHGEEFRNYILRPDGQPKFTTAIHLNRRDIREMRGLNTTLGNEDELSITSMMI